jgi:hypothetical protein
MISVSLWQHGHCDGGTISLTSGLFKLSFETPVISGITSLDFLINTVEFILTFFLLISSRLFKVAFWTVLPHNSTGSSNAFGLILPYLDTFHSTSINLVVVSSASYL